LKLTQTVKFEMDKLCLADGDAAVISTTLLLYFICCSTSARRQRSYRFGFRVKLPSVYYDLSHHQRLYLDTCPKNEVIQKIFL